MSYDPYSSPPRNLPTTQMLEQQAKSKLKPPGIALIVVGSIGLLCTGGYFLVSVALMASGAPEFKPPPELKDPLEINGFYVGLYGALFAMALNSLLQIFVILGGVAMLRAKGRGMAWTGSVLSVIPVLTSSCCVLGIPVGIWALIVLSDANVKRVFK